MIEHPATSLAAATVDFGRRVTRSLAVATLLLVAATVPSLAQLSGGAKPSFEVASVKTAKPRAGAGGFNVRNGRFIGQSVTLRLLVAISYGLQDSQITGGAKLGWFRHFRCGSKERIRSRECG
jgi:hypothetical protein